MQNVCGGTIYTDGDQDTLTHEEHHFENYKAAYFGIEEKSKRGNLLCLCPKCHTALLASIEVWQEYFQYKLMASDFRRDCTDYPPQKEGKKQPCMMAVFFESVALARYASAISADLTTSQACAGELAP